MRLWNNRLNSNMGWSKLAESNSAGYVFHDDSRHNWTVGYATGIQPYSMTHLLVTLVILGTVILLAVVGNVFVMTAVILERNLRTVANYLVVSLAVADLMVATLVMPLAAVNEVSQRWFLGKEACDMWVSFDVICCTCSILHLVAISLDRYWAVTKIDYIHNRSGKTILQMIGISWTLSIMISIPPLFIQKDSGYDPNESGECMINQDPGYTVYSTVGAFYLPFILMMIIYLKVFLAARARIRRNRRVLDKFQAPVTSATEFPVTPAVDGASAVSQSPMEELSMNTILLTVSEEGPNNDGYRNNKEALFHHPSAIPEGIDEPLEPATGRAPLLPLSSPSSSPVVTTKQLTRLSPPRFGRGSACSLDAPSSGKNSRRGSWIEMTKHYLDKGKKDVFPKASKENRTKEKLAQKRERKAARTLAIITGSFICCWLPFFIIAIVRPFCKDSCDYPPLLLSVINWLGYFNSLLNPIIYTIFNPDFRLAFRKILFGKYRRQPRYQRAPKQQKAPPVHNNHRTSAAATRNSNATGKSNAMGNSNASNAARTS